MSTLFEAITVSIDRKMRQLGMIGVAAPIFDTSYTLVNASKLDPSTSETVGITTQNNQISEIGDIVVDLDIIKNLKLKAKTVDLFVTRLLNIVNHETNGIIKLKHFPSSNGGPIIVIRNEFEIDTEDEKTQESSVDPLSLKDQYLTMPFGRGTSLVETISFNSDLSDGGMNIFNAIELQGIEGATSNELLSFTRTWIENTEAWAELSQQEKKDKRLEYSRTPKNLIDDVYLMNPSMGEETATELYEEFIEAIQNTPIKDSYLKYMPYTMEASLFGISDIWMGTRVYLDENLIIPF